MSNKRRNAFLTVVCTVLLVIAFCFSACEKQLSDEEKIVARIENFEKSYNDGDLDGFLENLTTKERKQIEAVFNLFGAAFGGLTGFSIDLADLFSLGIAMQEGDWLQVEIVEIEIVSEDDCVHLELTRERYLKRFG